MTGIIEARNAIVVFSKDDTWAAVAENSGKNLYVYDLINNKKTSINICGLNVFSAVFSEDNKYLAVLLYEERSNNLKSLLIAECETGSILETIDLKHYLKKDFSVITEMQFYSGIIVVSFQYFDASGAMLMSIDCNNNFTVQTKILQKSIIYHLHYAEKIVIFVNEKENVFSIAQSVKLVDPKNLNVLQSLDFEGVLDHNYYLNSFEGVKETTLVAMTTALYLIPFLRHKRYSVYKVDTSSNCLKLSALSVIKSKKLPGAKQFVYEKGYMLGEKIINRHGKKKIIGVYKIDNLQFVGEFVFGDKTAHYTKGNQSVDLISDFDASFSENETFTGFCLSSTGKYFLLSTNRKSYIFQAPPAFLKLF